MGCMCSSSGNRHDTEWEFSGVTRDRFSGAVQRAMQRPPKWHLTQFRPSEENVDMFYGTRRTNMMGFVDHQTLRVCYDHPLPGHVTVLAASQCGNPKHKYDIGQNKRNLAQLKQAIETELFSARAHHALSDIEGDNPLQDSLIAGDTVDEGLRV